MVLMLAGCAVPVHMRVRTSDDPQHVDRDVRFRTTYYFRVFDQCAPLKPAKLSNTKSDDPVFGPETTGAPVVLNDWLYRFRLTGKAHSLTSQVHFESGTLKAYQIDPFGANIAFDQKNQRFFPVSQQETIQDAQRVKALKAKEEQREATLDQITRLLDLRAQLIIGRIPTDKSTDKIDDLIAVSLESLADTPEAQRLVASTALVMADVAQVKATELIAAVQEATAEVEELQQASQPGSPLMNLPPPPTKSPPATDPTRKIEALHGVRMWYEEQLKFAQGHLLELKAAVQKIEKQAKSAFEDEKEKKRKYESAKNELKISEELRAGTDDTAVEVLKTKIKQFLDEYNTALAQTRMFQETITAGKLKEDLVEGHVQSLAELTASVVLLSASLEPVSQLTAQSLTTAEKPTACREGTQLQRGFQIMGPEGFRTFDQSERLIMAMSSSGKPLLSVMQELVGPRSQSKDYRKRPAAASSE